MARLERQPRRGRRDDVKPAAEHTDLKRFLSREGFSDDWIRQAVGDRADGRRRRQINADLIAKLKVLPKAP